MRSRRTLYQADEKVQTLLKPSHDTTLIKKEGMMILMPGLVTVSNSLQRKEDTLHRVWGQQDRLVRFVILALCLFIYPARERERYFMW